jgi:hypothetical protein
LDDRYRLDERIAAGGVGQVWRATDLLLERPVAVKVLRPEYSDHPETLERFRKEAKNAGALNNSHVAQVYDYGPSGPDGSPYLVMEYVDGPSLADILVVDPIDPALALDVTAQAAEGLAAAHKAGVIHRDVKPGNILISAEGVVKVTDFGIAHAAGQVPVTSPGLVMGTTQYMAPERIAGNPGTAASDLYALGIVLHECLTGVPPHDGTAAEVMAAHLYMPLPPLPADVPAELDVLVDRLTAKDPAKRISDARELAELAARLRDSMGGGTLVPLARGMVAGSGLQSALGVRSGPGGDQAAAVSPPGGMTPNTAVLYAQRGWTDSTGYVPGEWNVPQRMSPPPRPPGAPPGPGQPGGQRPGDQRKRAKGLALGAGVALVMSAGLVALFASGVLGGAPAANQTPAGNSATSAATAGQVPRPAPSGASRVSSPASGAVLPTATASAGATSPQSATGSKKPSTTPSVQPSTGSPASATGGASTTPSGGGPSTPPSGSSGSSTPSSGSASPSPSSCLLGICF